MIWLWVLEVRNCLLPERCGRTCSVWFWVLKVRNDRPRERCGRRCWIWPWVLEVRNCRLPERCGGRCSIWLWVLEVCKCCLPERRGRRWTFYRNLISFQQMETNFAMPMCMQRVLHKRVSGAALHGDICGFTGSSESVNYVLALATSTPDHLLQRCCSRWLLWPWVPHCRFKVDVF